MTSRTLGRALSACALADMNSPGSFNRTSTNSVSGGPSVEALSKIAASSLQSWLNPVFGVLLRRLAVRRLLGKSSACAVAKSTPVYSIVTLLVPLFCEVQ
jgi:hypothetical protein